MIESLRRITKVKISSSYFTPNGDITINNNRNINISNNTALVLNNTNIGSNGLSYHLQLLPLQPVSIDITFSLFLQQGGNINAGTNTTTTSSSGVGKTTIRDSAVGNDPSTNLSRKQSTNTIGLVLPHKNVSMQAALSFLTEYGEDDLVSAWVRAVQQQIFVPYLFRYDSVVYSDYIKQATVAYPHNIGSCSFFTSKAPICTDPLTPPRDILGEVSNIDTSSIVPAAGVSRGTAIIESLINGTLPSPKVTFKLNFTVPDCGPGPMLLGVLCTLLNQSALIAATTLPLGCLQFGTVFAEASLDRLLTLRCTSRYVCPNKVLVGCTVTSNINDNDDASMCRNIYLTSLHLDVPSSWLGRTLGSLSMVPHDPHQRIAGPHHHAPLISALTQSLSVTPIRGAGDYFPITLRRYESYNFVFVLQLQPEYAYLAEFLAKKAAYGSSYQNTTIPRMPHKKQESTTTVITTPITRRGTVSANDDQQRHLRRLEGKVGIADEYHARQLHDQLVAENQQRLRAQEQQMVVQQQLQAHIRTSSSVVLSFRRASTIGQRGGASYMIETLQESHHNNSTPSRNSTLFISPNKDSCHVTTPTFQDGEFKPTLQRGFGEDTFLKRQESNIGNRPEIPSSSVCNVKGIVTQSTQQLLLDYLLQDVIHTGVVLSYEVDNNIITRKMKRENNNNINNTASLPVTTSNDDGLTQTQQDTASLQPSTTSLRWETFVEWSFNKEHYPVVGGPLLSTTASSWPPRNAIPYNLCDESGFVN